MSLMDAKDKRIAELETLLKDALEDNARLKERIAILEKHSGNSSKPPSFDIVKAKPKTEKKTRKPNEKKEHSLDTHNIDTLPSPQNSSTKSSNSNSNTVPIASNNSTLLTVKQKTFNKRKVLFSSTKDTENTKFSFFRAFRVFRGEKLFHSNLK